MHPSAKTGVTAPPSPTRVTGLPRKTETPEYVLVSEAKILVFFSSAPTPFLVDARWPRPRSPSYSGFCLSHPTLSPGSAPVPKTCCLNLTFTWGSVSLIHFHQPNPICSVSLRSSSKCLWTTSVFPVLQGYCGLTLIFTPLLSFQWHLEGRGPNLSLLNSVEALTHLHFLFFTDCILFV